MLLFALTWSHYFFIFSLSLLSIFMVLVILVQRGRGGGLTGALGGMGGQSAFGTKAGDLFTRVTIVVAAIWVILSMAALKVLNPNTVPGFNPALRGQAAPTSKGDGSLLPSATKPGDAGAPGTDGAATGKAGDLSPEAPAAAPATPPATSETPAPATLPKSDN
jgi:preprotein translocase subunit SecG